MAKRSGSRWGADRGFDLCWNLCLQLSLLPNSALAESTEASVSSMSVHSCALFAGAASGQRCKCSGSQSRSDEYDFEQNLKFDLEFRFKIGITFEILTISYSVFHDKRKTVITQDVGIGTWDLSRSDDGNRRRGP